MVIGIAADGRIHWYWDGKWYMQKASPPNSILSTLRFVIEIRGT